MNDPAMAISCPKIAIVGDSRTKHFRSLLRNHHINPHLDISVFTYSGTTVVRAVRRFLERDSTGSEYVILLAGVNNLTKVEWSYDRSRRTVSPVFDNIPALVDSLTDSYTEAKMLLAREGHQCIICELTGLDINRYNKMTTYYEKHQDVINEGIPILNRTIYAMNHDDNLPTPFLQNSIHHKNTKGKPCRKAKYAKLYDGLHPDEKTAQVWLQQIIKAIKKLFDT